MAKLLKENPFLSHKDVDLRRLHVTFLAEATDAAAVMALSTVDSGNDEGRVIGAHVYLHMPGGYGNTKLSNATIEKKLSVRATTRNWNTVTKLAAMAADNERT